MPSDIIFIIFPDHFSKKKRLKTDIMKGKGEGRVGLSIIYRKYLLQWRMAYIKNRTG